MKINMEHSAIQLDDLPDEILMIIFKNMRKFEVLYSLIDVNQRLTTIARDRIFTNYLALSRHSPDGSVDSYIDSMIDRFCSQILPKIHHKIKFLYLDLSSMERVLLAANYPNLYGLTLYNVGIETARHFFTGKI
jgi:hypothetical protein